MTVVLMHSVATEVYKSLNEIGLGYMSSKFVRKESQYEHCNVFNYADDNTLSYDHPDPLYVKSRLESAACIAIRWFEQNQMKANPSKFQALVLGRNGKGKDIQFELPNGVLLESSPCVKLLGLYLDSDLNFSTHINHCPFVWPP